MKKKILAIVSLLLMAIIMTSCNNKKTYKLSLNYNSEMTEVTVNGKASEGTYEEGTTLLIKIEPKEGYLFESFLVDGEVVEISESLEHTLKLEKDTTIIVNMQAHQGYTLTVNGNIKFDYEATKANEYGKYDKGTNVTLSITAPKNYVVEKVTVNEKEVQMIGTACNFVIEEDTVVNVNFVSTITNISSAALESIQGKVKISGTYQIEYPDYDLIFNNYIETIFDENKVHQYEYSNDDQKETYNVTFFNNNGYAALYSIDLNNQVVVNTSKDVFADFDNPFKDLEVSDFVLNEEDGYYYLNKNLDETAATITGWNETIAELKVKVLNDKIVEVCIATTLLTTSANEYYMSTYQLEVSEHGAATVTEVTPYEHVAEHDTLKEALAKIGYNYTVNHLDHEDGYEDIEYTSYVLDKVTYCGYENVSGDKTVTYGYLEKEGYVYNFSYDGTTVTIGDALDISDFRDIQSDFSSFAPELFEYVGDGRYVARTSDLAAAIAYLIGYDYDVKRLGDYATSLELVLKGSTLYQVKFDYYVYGVYGNVVLTYSNFDTTICPIPLDNIEQVTVFDTYAGTYTSEDDTHTVIIGDSKIIIDGTEMVVEGFDSSKTSFYGTYNGETIAVTRYFGSSEFCVEVGDNFYVVSNETLYKETAVPTEYYGTFKSDEHTIVISEEGIMIDSEKFDLVYYEYMVGVVGTLNGVKYYLYIDLDENDNVVCYFLRPDLTSVWILDYVQE